MTMKKITIPFVIPLTSFNGAQMNPHQWFVLDDVERNIGWQLHQIGSVVVIHNEWFGLTAAFTVSGWADMDEIHCSFTERGSGTMDREHVLYDWLRFNGTQVKNKNRFNPNAASSFINRKMYEMMEALLGKQRVDVSPYEPTEVQEALAEQAGDTEVLAALAAGRT